MEYCVCMLTLSQVWLFETSWTVANLDPLSMEFSRQEYLSSLHFCLQGIFPTQESNLCLLWLLHRQADSLPLHHLGSLMENYFSIKKGAFVFYVVICELES